MKQGISRRRVLQGSLGAAALLLPSPYAWVWAQSEGAARLLRAPKQALVLGNAGYRNAPTLRNPANDAKGMAAALTDSGFTVTTVLDATRAQMMEAIAAYVRSLADRKCVGIFYYAGHGVQLAWRNYLVPVDAAIHKQEDIPAQTVDVGSLMGGISKATNPMNVLILDACRENPFGDFRVEQKGLSQMDAPPATLLAYATAPGNVATDGDGANGLYTGNLLREMKVREAKIEDVFKRVRLSVRRASQGAQVPWESTSLEEDFYFIPPETLKRLSREEEERAFKEELAMFERARDLRSVPELEGYLQQFPSGRFAELAQLHLDETLAAQGEKPVQPVATEGNPNTVGTARADTRYRVGDLYVYRLVDRRTAKEIRLRRVVTEITANEVRFNDGKYVTDLLGNTVRSGNGRYFTPHQEIPLEYAVGKRWSTRYDVTGTGNGTVDMKFKVVARERITVPAGTFNCFRIEGRGTNTYVFRNRVIESSVVFWRAPQRVRLPIAHEEVHWMGGNIVQSERRELLRFKQS